MKILALDLSSKSSGYAIFEDQLLLESGVATSSSTDVIKRIYVMRDKIKELLEKYDIDKIIVEEVRTDYKNAHTYKILTWVQAAMVFTAYDVNKGIEIEYIQASSWRSKIGIHTGRGIKRDSLNQKDIEFVRENYGLDVNDDEADAICIGHSVIQNLNEEINWE